MARYVSWAGEKEARGTEGTNDAKAMQGFGEEVWGACHGEGEMGGRYGLLTKYSPRTYERNVKAQDSRN